MSRLERARLWGALALLFLASALLVVGGADLRNTADRISLDPSWAIDLESQWLLGRVSGRDFFFTYGPLAQWITLASRLWRHSLSPLDGWMWTPVVGQLLRYGVVTLIVGAWPRMTVRRAVAVVVVSWFVPTPWFTARQLLVVLSVVAFAQALAAPKRSSIAWGGAAALAGFAGQLFTFEILVYTLGSWVGLLGVAGLLTRLRPERFAVRPLVPGTVAAFTSWLLLQGSIELIFRATGSTYHALDYFGLNWEIAKGYNLTMGTPWLADTPHPRFAELVILGLVIAMLGACWRAMRSHDERDETLSIVAVGLASLIVLKGAIVRADAIHIKGALAPTWLFFTLLATQPRLIVWWRALASTAIVLLFSLYGVDTAAFTGLVGEAQPTLLHKLHQALHAEPIAPSSLAAPVLRPQLRRDWVLTYPYGNHLVVAADRPSLAPVVQAYSAHTSRLQHWFVAELERHHGRLDVLFAEDGSEDNWMIDGVPSLTRTPTIFRYLLENFELAGGTPPRGHFHVLRPRPETRPLVARSIKEGPCALLEVELQFDYGKLASLGRPLGAVLEVTTNGETVHVPVVPIEAGRPFSTLVYLGGSQDRARILFGAGGQRGLEVKRARLVLQPASRFSIAPAKMEVRALRCVVPASDPSWGPGEVDLLPQTGVSTAQASLLHIEGDALFMHGGREVELSTAGVTPGLCLRATVGWHADALKSREEARDGIAFVASLRDRQGKDPGVSTRVPLAVGQVDAELQLPLPPAKPLTIRLAVDPMTSDTWDWGLWRRLRVAPCDPLVSPAAPR